MKLFNNVFIFIDDEENYILVNWNSEIFAKEYVKLQNEYVECDNSFCDFYIELQERLKKYWIAINTDPDVLQHNYLDF